MASSYGTTDETSLLLETSSASGYDSVFALASAMCFLKVGGIWFSLVLASIASLLWSGSLCSDTYSSATCDSINNYMVQQLTCLFTLISLYSLPVRTARFLSLCGESKTGFDFHGRPTPRPGPRSLMAETYDPCSFYHIGYGPRCVIATLQFVSALAQFVDQGFHFKYASYASSQSMPGLLWDNLFFLTSLIAMLTGLAIEGCFDAQVRKKTVTKQSSFYERGGTFAPVATPSVLLRGACCCYSLPGYMSLAGDVPKPPPTTMDI